MAPRVGDMLVEAGVITRSQLDEALAQQARSGGRLGSNLVELGFIDERTLAQFLARQLSLPAVTAASIDRITPTVAMRIPAELAERLRVVPIREDAGRLWVAMADPTDQAAIADLEAQTRLPVRTMVCPELLMHYALEKHYRVRRKPRVVEVRTGHSDLLRIEDAARTAGPAGQTARAPAPAPVTYDVLPKVDLAELDAATGYLDEAARGPETPAPVAPQRIELGQLAQLLASAGADEQVLDLAVRWLHQDMARVWALYLKQGELQSWGGRGLDVAALIGWRVPLGEVPLIAQSLSEGEVLLGRLPPPSLGRLAQPLGVHQETLGAIVPVRIGRHAVAVLVGVEASLEAMRKKPELERLALKLDQALHINYLRRLLLS